MLVLGPSAAPAAPPDYPELPPLTEAQMRHLAFLGDVLAAADTPNRFRTDAAAGLLGLGRPEATEVLVGVLTAGDGVLEPKMAVVRAIGKHAGPPPRLLEPVIGVLLSLGDGNGRINALRDAVRQFGPAGLERLRDIVVDPSALLTARRNALEILADKARKEELRILAALADTDPPLDDALRQRIIAQIQREQIFRSDGRTWTEAVTRALADREQTDFALEREVGQLEERIVGLHAFIEQLLEDHYRALETTRVFDRLHDDLASPIDVVRVQALERADILIRDGILLPEAELQALRDRLVAEGENAANRILAAQLLDQLDDAEVGRLAAGHISADAPAKDVIPYLQIVAAHPAAEGYSAVRTLLDELPRRPPIDADLATAAARALWGVATTNDDLIPESERIAVVEALLRVEPAPQAPTLDRIPAFDRVIAYLAPEDHPAFAVRAAFLKRQDQTFSQPAVRRRAVAEAFVARGSMDALRPHIDDGEIYPLLINGFARQTKTAEAFVDLARMRPPDTKNQEPWREALKACARALTHEQRVVADRELDDIEGMDASLRASLLTGDLDPADVPPLLAGPVLPHLWRAGNVTRARNIIASLPSDAEIKDFKTWRLRFALRARDYDAPEVVAATPEEWVSVAKALAEADPEAAALLIEVIRERPDLPERLLVELDGLVPKTASGSEPAG